jgi:hypothetical protein
LSDIFDVAMIRAASARLTADSASASMDYRHIQAFNRPTVASNHRHNHIVVMH